MNRRACRIYRGHKNAGISVNLKERDHLGELGVDGIIINQILKRQSVRG